MGLAMGDDRIAMEIVMLSLEERLAHAPARMPRSLLWILWITIKESIWSLWITMNYYEEFTMHDYTGVVLHLLQRPEHASLGIGV